MCQRHEICTTKQETQAKTGNEIVPTLPTSKWEKKGWKMSGKVANGKVTVVEYSKSKESTLLVLWADLRGQLKLVSVDSWFFEIRVTNHLFYLNLFGQKHTCKQKYTSSLFLHVQLKIWRDCNFHSHFIICNRNLLKSKYSYLSQKSLFKTKFKLILFTLKYTTWECNFHSHILKSLYFRN